MNTFKQSGEKRNSAGNNERHSMLLWLFCDLGTVIQVF